MGFSVAPVGSLVRLLAGSLGPLGASQGVRPVLGQTQAQCPQAYVSDSTRRLCLVPRKGLELREW